MPPVPFVPPGRSVFARLAAALADAMWVRRLRRATLGRLPFLVLDSDVHDILYANWVIPAAAAARFVPPGVAIRQMDGLTILTVLTYAHGHFGPSLAGPLRRVFPSPLQSNWRLYVDAIGGVPPAEPTVLFLANVFDKAIYAIGTRLVSDVMVAHHAERFEHCRSDDRWMSGAQGGGSAPDWMIEAQRSDDATLPPAFAPFFDDYDDAVRALCLQDAAVAATERDGVIALAGIDLPIDVRTVIPLSVEHYAPGRLLDTLGADAAPFCFAVPAVRFRALSERLCHLPD